MVRSFRFLNFLAVFALVAGTAVTSDAQTKLLRFPDVSGDRLVFCYAGDLWTASTDGGMAVRLTAHAGQELFPKFSPDGEWIAFTGQYDGDEQVYVVPSTGGVPTQLTYYPARGPLPPRWGYDNQVYGWTPDGSRVLFRSLRDADSVRSEGNLFTVSVQGGLPEALPMPTAGAGDFSPDGSKIAYSPLWRDFRSWKRYQGGWAQDLFIFDMASHDATKIAASVRTERDPMWIGDAVFFSSDRDGTLNLFSYDVGSESVSQLTNSSTWDVRWPSSDNKSTIVYELDGELNLYDVASNANTKIQITVPNDGLAMRPSRVSVADKVEDYALSPKAERALFVARGDIFSVPIEKGPTRNLTQTSGAHDKWARWSPDGSKIAFISDMTGEDEVYLIAQDGSGESEQLTEGGEAMRYAPEWSPDGKWLAFSDKDGKLYVVNVESKEQVEVADERRGGLRDYVWSPKGGFLSFSLTDVSGFNSIYIWSVADRNMTRVTGPLNDDYSPAWDPKGKYLYFLSDRAYAPQISTIEWNYAGSRTTGIFALALQEDGENPFGPESDEVTVEDAEKKDKNGEADDDKKSKKDNGKEEKDDDADDKDKEPIKIDFDGLGDRIVRVPVDAGNYNGLSAVEGHLVYASFGPFFYGRRSPEPVKVNVYSIKDRKASELAKDVDGGALAYDGKKILVGQSGKYNLFDISSKPGKPKSISTQGLKVDLVPSEEWEEIFDEVWRRFRDFFYVENMHGYDWKAIGDQYRTLLPYVAHRSDLNYVLSEMVSELSVGHAYIQGGDWEVPDRPSVALPGARFAFDDEAGLYKIAAIFEGNNAEEKYRSPLTEVGVNAKVGDYVLAIDGRKLTKADNPYKLLQHKSDQVVLSLSSTSDSNDARDVTYKPLRGETPLLYLKAVQRNWDLVNERTDGKVGYLHIPDMGGNGIQEFIKWFYPQLRKEGMVIDVRSNGGGNVSQWIIERLDSKLLGTRFGRLSEDPGTYPNTVFHGHKVCLLNETSASDGDIFPYRFRAAGLGPLIGKRSWGGVVGISGQGPLIDGAPVFVPLSGTNAPDGSWIIEGYGVDPDIEVENDPKSVIEGRDPQLERGITEVLRAMEENPMTLPERPADPVKTK
ncbi:MAG: peptidase S41 [bacterium]|nr:peptidase S41 [bacterium]